MGVQTVAHVAEELKAGTDGEEELAGRLPQTEPVLVTSWQGESEGGGEGQGLTSAAETGDDQCEEGEEQRWGGGEVWDLDSLVQLVGHQHQEHQQRHHEEAVPQRWVCGGSALVSIDVRHPEENASEDDCVEDSHEWDAEDYPERNEGDLPGPGYNAEQDYQIEL